MVGSRFRLERVLRGLHREIKLRLRHVRRVLIFSTLTLSIRVAKNNVHGIREHFQRVFVLVVRVLHAPSNGGHRGGSPPIGQRGRPVLVFDKTQRVRVVVAALFPFPQSHIFALFVSSLLFFTRRHRGVCVSLRVKWQTFGMVLKRRICFISRLSPLRKRRSLSLSNTHTYHMLCRV